MTTELPVKYIVRIMIGIFLVGSVITFLINKAAFFGWFIIGLLVVGIITEVLFQISTGD